MESVFAKKNVWLVLFVFQWSISYAQPRLEKHFSYQNYTTYDGLTQSQVTHLYQDKKGYLWICTKEGVSRFDGKNFKNFYSEKGSYLLDHVEQIFEYNGLYYFISQKEINTYKSIELQHQKTIPFPSGYSILYLNDTYFLSDTLYFLNCKED